MIFTTTADKRTVEVLDEPIGMFTSKWRLRRVTLYQDASNPDMIVAVGIGFNGGHDCTSHESRASYAQEIGKFGTIYN